MVSTLRTRSSSQNATRRQCGPLANLHRHTLGGKASNPSKFQTCNLQPSPHPDGVLLAKTRKSRFEGCILVTILHLLSHEDGVVTPGAWSHPVPQCTTHRTSMSGATLIAQLRAQGRTQHTRKEAHRAIRNTILSLLASHQATCKTQHGTSATCA